MDIIFNNLADSQLFKGIEKDNLLALLKCLKPQLRKYKKNDFIAIAGDRFPGLGIMLEGEASIIKENVAGKSTIIDIIETQDMFGEVLAFSGIDAWNVTIEALEPCKVIFISSERIISECQNVCPWHNRIIFNMLNILSEKALILNKKVDYLTMVSLREKICTYLLEQYHKTGSPIFMLSMNRKELAEFLNVSRPSLSREMSRLRDEGIIDFHMSTIKIVSLDKLKRTILN